MRILIFMCMLAFAGCQKNDIVVNQILIDRVEGAEALPVSREQLHEWVEKTLSSQTKIVVRPSSKEGGVLRVKVGAAITGPAGIPSRIYIAAQLDRDTDAAQKPVAETWIPYPPDPKTLSTVFDAALRSDLEKLLSAGTGQKAAGRDAAQIIRDYVDGEKTSEQEMMAALQKVAQEKDASATEALTKILKGSNLRLSIKALSALGQIGDPKTIPDITNFAERKAPEVRRHAIEAARKIGGPHAAAWLFTLSTGHDDAQVRSAASLALVDVERRMKNNH